MVEGIRRVTTSQSLHGRSYISSDVTAPTQFSFPDGLNVSEVWKTDAMPVVLQAAPQEPTTGPLILEPPKHGNILRVSDIPPQREPLTAEQIKELLGRFSGGHDAIDNSSSGGLAMHRTETLDYAIILSGQIVLVVDNGEVELSAGDVVIQGGANHAWDNRSGENCRIAFIMIDAVYPDA